MAKTHSPLRAGVPAPICRVNANGPFPQRLDCASPTPPQGLSAGQTGRPKQGGVMVEGAAPAGAGFDRACRPVYAKQDRV